MADSGVTNDLFQTTSWPSFSDNAIKLLRERYLRRDDSGILVENPDGMLQRVAHAIAEPARLFGEDAAFWEARFFERMRCLEFLPNSPTLMNAGLRAGQLAACFVLPIEDDLNSIFTAADFLSSLSMLLLALAALALLGLIIHRDHARL